MGIVVLIMAVFVLLNSTSGTNTKSVLESFTSYQSYIIYGPEQTGADTNWFLIGLADNLYPSELQSNFISQATSLGNEFDQNFTHSDFTSDMNLSEKVQVQKEFFSTIVDYINREVYVQDLYKLYDTEGFDTAKAKLDSYIHSDLREGSTRSMDVELNKYLDAELSLYHFYSQAGCTADGIISGVCVQNLAGTPELEALRLVELRAEQLLPHIYRNLTEKYEAIISEIRGALIYE